MANEGVVVFDLETQRGFDQVGGRENMGRLGLSLAVAYHYSTDSFRTYFEKDSSVLVGDLRAARLVVGFNIISFDFRVLQPYTEHDLRSLTTLDIMLDVKRKLGHRVALDSLVAATLGRKKIADGLMALEWFRLGEFGKIEEYCREDVRLTRDLYEYGRKEGFIYYTDKYTGQKKGIPVSW